MNVEKLKQVATWKSILTRYCDERKLNQKIPNKSVKRSESPLQSPDSRRRKINEAEGWENQRLAAWRDDWSKKRVEDKEPWKHENDNLISEPPDNNYKHIIVDDQEKIDELLADHKLHFAVSCRRYNMN